VVKNTTETLTGSASRPAHQQAVEDCLKVQAATRQDRRDQNSAAEVLTGQFDADLLHQTRDAQGEQTFEEFSKRHQFATEN